MAKALNVTLFGNSAGDDDDPLLLLLRLWDFITGFRVVFGFEVISPVDAAKSRNFCERLVLLLPRLPFPPPPPPPDDICIEAVDLPPPYKSWCDAGQLTTGCTEDGAMYLQR